MKKYLARLLLLLLCFVSFGQNISSTSDGINFIDKSKTFHQNNQLDSAYYYAKKSFNFFNRHKNDSLLIQSCLQLIPLTYKLNKENKADYYFKVAEKTAKESNQWVLLSSLYSRKGSIYYRSLKDNLAMFYYLKSDSILSKHQLKNKTEFSNLINITRLLYFSTNVDIDTITSGKIEDYLIKAIHVAESIDNPISKSIAYVEYANFLSRKNKHKKASIYINKALCIIKDEDNNKIKSQVYFSAAGNYWRLKKIDSAEYYYKKRIQLFVATNQQKDLAYAYAGIGGFYNKLNRYKEAISYQTKALSLFNTLEPKDNGKILGTLNGLATAYANDGQYKKAFSLVNKAYILNDSIRDVQHSNETLNLEGKYETQKKEQEIQLLKFQKNNQRNLLIAIISMLFITGLFFFILYLNRRKTAQKLTELDRAKSMFFANVSHEFRTPLTLITAPLEQRLNNENLSEDDLNDFEMMQRNAHRLLSLIDQLLDLSKLESGKLNLKVRQENVSILLKTLAASFQYSASQKKIKYEVTIAEIENAWVDSEIIEKITINLLSNAFKYTPTNGIVSFKSFVKNNFLQLFIENNSTFLSNQELEKLFDRFYQTDTKNEGVGIGLSLVKELVLLSHGTIKAQNTKQQTILFSVSIPIFRNAYSKNEIDLDDFKKEEKQFYSKYFSKSESKQTNEGFINKDLPILLIVEDDSDIRNFIKKSFSKKYQVIEAENGQIGIEKALNFIPNIIISDIMMPEVNGIELCQQLKTNECTSHIPIVLLTAKVEEKDQYKGLKIGADAYITKPFKLQLLESQIENILINRALLYKRYSQEITLKPKDVVITNLEEQFLKRMQDVLDNKLIESSFTIEEFSQALGMSRMQLHRKLKALTGSSPSEFIRLQRLKLAAQLLKKSNINVSQVGYSVGFNNPSYFGKCFKEKYHCTPAEYAKSSH